MQTAEMTHLTDESPYGMFSNCIASIRIYFNAKTTDKHPSHSLTTQNAAVPYHWNLYPISVNLFYRGGTYQGIFLYRDDVIDS